MRNFFAIFIDLLAMLFLLFVALPAYVFWLNSEDITWQGSLWVMQFAIALCIAVLVSIILAISNNSIRKFFSAASAVIFVFVLLRAFFVPVSFGILDGVEISEVQLTADVSLWGSLALLAVIVLCTCKYRQFIANLMQSSTLILLLIVIYIYSSYYIARGENDDQLAAKSHISRFSKNSNIMVMSFDALQNDLLIDLLAEDRRLASLLDGFTMYSNVTGYAPTTVLSLLSTISGRYMEAGEKGDAIKNLLERYDPVTLPNVLAAHNYDVDVFNLQCKLKQNSKCIKTASVLPESVTADYRLTAYDVAILKVMPKSMSWQIVQSLSGHNNDANKNELDLISEDKAGHGFGIDKYIFKLMYEDMYLVDKPVFKFHHYLHSHQPIRFDANCAYDIARGQNEESAKSEMICVLREFNKFVSRLKEMGIYDDALIVLTSDHGYESNIQPQMKKGKEYNGGFINNSGVWPASRYWPVLLIKQPDSTGPLTLNDKPVSLIDIAPTIYNIAHIDFCSREQCDGVGLQDNQPRTTARKAIFYKGGTKDFSKEKYLDTRYYKTEEVVGDAYHGIKNAMISLSLNNQELACNQPVNFAKDMRGYSIDGVSRVESWGRWSDAATVIIRFYMNPANCSENKISMQLKGFVSQSRPQQFTRVFLNDKQIGEVMIKLDKQSPGNFSFNIPSPLFNQNKVNVLRFDIDNPVSPKSLGQNSDPRLLGIGFQSMIFQ